VFKWGGAGWNEITSARTLGLVDSYAAEAFGASITAPLWSEPHYYTTIQTADVDGDGAAELLARGSFGIRTWRLDHSELRWTRYLPYGYPDPAFAAAGQLSAYRALNALLGVADVRRAYGGSDASLLSTYQTRIEGTCADRTTTIPPQYGSCTPPSSSAVAAADWTVVANAIIAELFHAQQVARYYDELKSAQANLFADNREDLAAVAGQLKLDARATDQDAGVDLLSLVSDITDVLATFAEAGGQEEISTPLFIFSSVMGAIAGAQPSASGIDFSQTYAQAIEHILAHEQQREDVVEAQLSFVRGDLRLLTTVGELVSRPSPSVPLWQVDRDAYTSAARQAFATWVYQTFLPVVWDRWVITGCRVSTFTHCTLPADGPHMAAYDAAAGSFTGLLPKQTPCFLQCLRSSCITTCSWGGPRTSSTFSGARSRARAPSTRPPATPGNMAATWACRPAPPATSSTTAAAGISPPDRATRTRVRPWYEDACRSRPSAAG
jgi:hypothetical protein